MLNKMNIAVCEEAALTSAHRALFTGFSRGLAGRIDRVQPASMETDGTPPLSVLVDLEGKINRWVGDQCKVHSAYQNATEEYRIPRVSFLAPCSRVMRNEFLNGM